MAIDLRFYDCLEKADAGSIAKKYGVNPHSRVQNVVTGVSAFSEAGPQDLCFVEDKNILLERSGEYPQGPCFISEGLASHVQGQGFFIPVKNAKQSFAELANTLFRPKPLSKDGTAPNIHDSAEIGPNVFIAAGVAIGPRTHIGPNSVIGAGVQIGADCQIGPNVTVSCALVGNHVRLLAGARLGEAGFGLVQGKSGLEDLPHFGRVIVQDSVTIGANSCVDRGMLGDTVIGEGSKIDNLCHIGHNTQIGRNVVMAAFAGMSGSVTIGDGVQMGGRVGLTDHLTVGAGAQIAAGSAVLNHVPEGEIWAGMPAKSIKTWQRELVWLKQQAERKSRK